jgi:hypothetical protein
MTSTRLASKGVVRLSRAALTGLLVLGIGAAAEEKGPPPAGPDGKAPGKGRVTGPGPGALAEPLALAAKARAAYAGVRDYSCVLIKREAAHGKLSPTHVIQFRMRVAPFSLHMAWQEPRAMKGQEVCYVEGKNNGDMRVKPAGLLGAVGFVSLSPDDPRAKQASRHRITDAGIGWVIQECSTGWELERTLNLTTVRTGTYVYARTRCTRVELTHLGRAGGKIRHYRNVVYFDQQTNLPLRVENYDWPKTPGQPGELVEVYSYVNVRLNANLPDSVFVR